MTGRIRGGAYLETHLGPQDTCTSTGVYFRTVLVFSVTTEHSGTLTMVSRRALILQVGCAAGCLRCRKASSRGQSVQVLATAAMSTSHLHIWQVTSSSIGDNEDVCNTLSQTAVRAVLTTVAADALYLHN